MSTSNKKARTNFSIGPQLAILQNGVETIEYDASTQHISDTQELFSVVGQGSDLQPNPDGTYDLPELPLTEILNSAAAEEIRTFNDTELQIAATFGIDVDIAKNIYLSGLIRANYSFTDMRNSDLIEIIKNNNIEGLIDKRANLALGFQFGVNYMFGGVRSFNAKDAVKAVKGL